MIAVGPLAVKVLLSLAAAIGYWLFAPLHTRSKSDLAPCFVDDHRHGIRKIETPAVGHHGQTNSLLLDNCPQNLIRQSTAFRTKKKRIAFCVLNQVIPLSAFGRDGKQAAIVEALHAFGPAVVDSEHGELVIVQSSTHQLFIFQRKPSGFTRCSLAPVLAQRRMMLPVLGEFQADRG